LTKQMSWWIHAGAALTIADSWFTSRAEVARFVRRIDSNVEEKWDVVRTLWTFYNIKNSLRTRWVRTY
jgi:hypothetical protein